VTNQQTDQGTKTVSTGGVTDAAIDLLMAGVLTKNISFLVVPTGFASDGNVHLESYWAIFRGSSAIPTGSTHAWANTRSTFRPRPPAHRLCFWLPCLRVSSGPRPSQRRRRVRSGQQSIGLRDFRARSDFHDALQRVDFLREQRFGFLHLIGSRAQLTIVLWTRSEVFPNGVRPRITI